MNDKSTQVNQYKCESCGANLVFDPDSGNLICPHCETQIELSRDNDVKERDFSDLTKTENLWDKEKVHSYKCVNCGSQTVMEKSEISSTCPFCGSAVVVDQEALASVKPDTVIPFEVNTNTAVDALLKWRKRRWLAPNAFRKMVGVDQMKGVYHPMWTFDGYTTTAYEGRLGRTRTRVVTRNGKTTTQTYIEWFNVRGTRRNTFDDIIISGAETIDQKNLDKLQPFEQSKYCVYSDQYLAGYVASNYTLAPEKAFEIAKDKMKKVIQSEIMQHHNANHVDYLNLNMHFDAKSFKYLMLPIYVTATKFKEKVFNQFVAGVVTQQKKKSQIKVAGKSPLSPIKVTLLSLGIAIGIGLLGWLMAISGFFA
ncbi:MAG: TFIIB-type zinc ribbon-containing protein [Clostridia bacterium]|nr:TFIIB-type zinc ribbon-containing protein [Clostridia bacterium]